MRRRWIERFEALSEFVSKCEGLVKTASLEHSRYTMFFISEYLLIFQSREELPSPHATRNWWRQTSKSGETCTEYQPTCTSLRQHDDKSARASSSCPWPRWWRYPWSHKILKCRRASRKTQDLRSRSFQHPSDPGSLSKVVRDGPWPPIGWNGDHTWQRYPAHVVHEFCRAHPPRPRLHADRLIRAMIAWTHSPSRGTSKQSRERGRYYASTQRHKTTTICSTPKVYIVAVCWRGWRAKPPPRRRAQWKQGQRNGAHCCKW